MGESQAATLDRLRAVEKALGQPRSTEGKPPSLRGLEQTAAAMLHVMSLLSEVSKDLQEQASALRTESGSTGKAAAAVPIVEDLVTKLRVGHTAAFNLHLAVQGDSAKSRFVDPADIVDDGENWVRAKSTRE